jgi:hypothetical protein
MSVNHHPREFGHVVSRFVGFALCVGSVVVLSPTSWASSSTPLAQIKTELAASSHLDSLPTDVQPATSEWTNLWAKDFGAVATGGGNSSCWDQAQSSSSLSNCVFGDRSGSRTLVLTGDSRAWMWEPAFDLWGKTTHWKVIVLTKGSCQPWPDDHQEYFDNAPFPACGTFQENVAKYINKNRPNVVVAAGSVPVLPTTAVARVKTDVKQFVDSIAPSRARVLIVSPSPSFYAYDFSTHSTLSAPTCLASHAQHVQACDDVSSGQLLNYFMNVVINQSRLPGSSRVLNLNELLCTTKCPMISDGILIYIDNDHVSYDWAVHVSKALGELLAPLVKGVH